jgi:hypothetical protein
MHRVLLTEVTSLPKAPLVSIEGLHFNIISSRSALSTLLPFRPMYTPPEIKSRAVNPVQIEGVGKHV